MFRTLAALLSALLAASEALAQATNSAAFIPTPVPTLGEAGLLGLIAAAAAAGGWALRKRNGRGRK